MNGSFLFLPQFWGSVLETSKQTNVRCPSCKPYAVHPEWGDPKCPKLDDFRCQNKWSGCSLENSRLNIHIHVVKWTPSKHWHCAPAAAIGIMFPLSLIHTLGRKPGQILEAQHLSGNLRIFHRKWFSEKATIFSQNASSEVCTKPRNCELLPLYLVHIDKFDELMQRHKLHKCGLLKSFPKKTERTAKSQDGQ
jgi:hypothetical protein